MAFVVWPRGGAPPGAGVLLADVGARVVVPRRERGLERRHRGALAEPRLPARVDAPRNRAAALEAEPADGHAVVGSEEGVARAHGLEVRRRLAQYVTARGVLARGALLDPAGEALEVAQRVALGRAAAGELHGVRFGEVAQGHALAGDDAAVERAEHQVEDAVGAVVGGAHEEQRALVLRELGRAEDLEAQAGRGVETARPAPDADAARHVG